jgi:hypothetical protein
MQNPWTAQTLTRVYSPDCRSPWGSRDNAKTSPHVRSCERGITYARPVSIGAGRHRVLENAITIWHSTWPLNWCVFPSRLKIGIQKRTSRHLTMFIAQLCPGSQRLQQRQRNDETNKSTANTKLHDMCRHVQHKITGYYTNLIAVHNLPRCWELNLDFGCKCSLEPFMYGSHAIDF